MTLCYIVSIAGLHVPVKDNTEPGSFVKRECSGCDRVCQKQKKTCAWVCFKIAASKLLQVLQCPQLAYQQLGVILEHSLLQRDLVAQRWRV